MSNPFISNTPIPRPLVLFSHPRSRLVLSG